ncbi:leucyl aminopeptidase [Candidatus Odyssella acanthamoebae]|uniref:Probable cytosol aminopeptidase n=1 Tax=Candidatus Odyssella acanthamoebae TaxID=91604 RepID=A0A077AYJ9_9PROT|nr:leucyl aminopeptidase [Candidatus Paracaedibacter acanthamoebae]AIK96698.1 peptidase M17 [Candidatus Paracaedibacter acanthamoebae]
MKIEFNKPALPTAGILAVIITSKNFDSFISDLDAKMSGQLKAIVNADDFDFKKGSVVSLVYPQGTNLTKLHLIAADAEKLKDHYQLELLGAKIYSALGKEQAESVTIYSPELGDVQAAGIIASGLLLKSWSFPKYFTKKEKSEFCQVKHATVLTENTAETFAKFKELEQVAEGVFLARHVASEPPNVIYPETLAQQAQSLEKLGVKVEVFGEKELTKMGFNALLGVGQGSSKESKVVVMQWNGGNADDKPVAFVGKGVTFDTGGISIKAAQDMDAMKWDMGGAGAVLGVMRALAGRNAKVNAVGVMGLVENMPDGNAQRPGDVVTSLSGQTIEILNTDAEGRLVLADALWYTQDRFKPSYMVNLATLTGAVIIALGSDHAGLFSNDDELADMLAESGKKVSEKLWRLPLSEAYDKDIDSLIADVKNLGNGRNAGSIAAAQFLQRFVNGTKWAHLDIAGTTWDSKAKGTYQAGATAFGVRLLNHWVKKHIEKATS